MNYTGKLFKLLTTIAYWPEESKEPIVDIIRPQADAFALHGGSWECKSGEEYVLLLYRDKIYRTWINVGNEKTFMELDNIQLLETP